MEEPRFGWDWSEVMPRDENSAPFRNVALWRLRGDRRLLRRHDEARRGWGATAVGFAHARAERSEGRRVT